MEKEDRLFATVKKGCKRSKQRLDASLLFFFWRGRLADVNCRCELLPSNDEKEKLGSRLFERDRGLLRQR
jgi:hypothetical protein